MNKLRVVCNKCHQAYHPRVKHTGPRPYPKELTDINKVPTGLVIL